MSHQEAPTGPQVLCAAGLALCCRPRSVLGPAGGHLLLLPLCCSHDQGTELCCLHFTGQDPEVQGAWSLPETPSWKGMASASHGAADPTLSFVCGIRQDTLQGARGTEPWVSLPPALWRRVNVGLAAGLACPPVLAGSLRLLPHRSPWHLPLPVVSCSQWRPSWASRARRWGASFASSVQL